MPGLSDRLMLMDFLDLAYRGGVNYKNGVDPRGFPVLIEHESEIVSPMPSAGPGGDDGGGMPLDVIVKNKFARRQRMATYENLVKPISDKFSAYLTRSAPKRVEGVEEDVKRLELDAFIASMVEDGLKFAESWIGWDSADIAAPDADVTEREAAEADPEDKGQPYLVIRDPRSVVDFEMDGESVARVVFEEVVTQKGSLTSSATGYTTFREWTAKDWVLYLAVESEKNEEGAITSLRPVLVNSTSRSVEIVEIGRGTHRFGRCPWVRFMPVFPIEDIAELNRALFNVSSLIDEELYKNTFTQKYCIGIRATDLQGAYAGPGNMLAIPNTEAQIGVLGAIEGQAQSLMARAAEIREAIYGVVSLESKGKNVAEAAEKKKRDMEALYSLLSKITTAIEKAENELLEGVGLIADDESDERTQYDRQFDVNSLADLLADLKEVTQLPFTGAAFKRSQIQRVMAKMDPFGDQTEYVKDMDKLMDASNTTATALQTLKDAGCLTPNLAITVLGVPESEQAEFKKRFDEHADAALSAFDKPPVIGPDGLPVEPDGQDGAGDGETPEDQSSGGFPGSGAAQGGEDVQPE